MGATYTQLKGGITHVGQPLLSDNLEANFWTYLNWAFLGIGNFFNVQIPRSPGAYGGNLYQLGPASDRNYADGQVWQGARKDWVWETGVDYPTQPIRVSGVFVDGGFHPATGVGPYAHRVDYPNGRVVFDAPIPTSSVVTCEHSPRWYQFYTADAAWWQQIQTDSFRVDDPQFAHAGSGAWDVLGANRIQLPAVVVEAVPNVSRAPLELGSHAAVVRQEVRFHVLGEDRAQMKFAHDAIVSQQEKVLRSFDKDKMYAQDAYPLDADGSPKPSGLMYPDLVADASPYLWRQVRIKDTKSLEMPRIGETLHYAMVRATVEVDMP